MYSCTGNQMLHQYALNLPDMNIQHLPILASSHQCDVALLQGRLASAHCTETHHFQPFSHAGQGPTTTVTQSLVFRSQAEASLAPASSDVRTDLTFVQQLGQREEVTEESIVREQLARVNQPGFRDSELPDIFRSLVHSMRHLHHSHLVLIHNDIAQEKKSKKLFEDALPLLKTDSGISLMRDIIASGSLDQAVIDSWFASLTFYKNPTRAMLTVLSTFLEPQPPPHHSALLGISSLASTFCAARPDCLQVAEMRHLVDRLQRLLGQDCTTSGRAQEDSMVLVLKALRNVGLMTGSADTLQSCYMTKSHPMWVRVAAVETAQTLRCHHQDQEFGLLATLRDRQEDSELRIAAYRALVACPNEADVMAVKELLLNEQINQGST
jgi:hypothetical protein